MSARVHKVALGPLQLSIEWRITLFTLILLPFLVALGFWQLERAEEKRELASRHADRAAMVALSGADLFRALDSLNPAGADSLSLADRKVTLLGQLYPDDYVLIDNRIREGRFGYEVITLMATPEGRVPVNLGWIAGDPARRSTPNPSLVAGDYSVSGRLYIPQKQPYQLGPQREPSALPVVLQSFDATSLAPALSSVLGEGVLPAVVRIAAEDPLALEASWVVVNQSPEKHTAYAVQWFTMAAALMLAFIFRSSNLLSLLRGGWAR